MPIHPFSMCIRPKLQTYANGAALISQKHPTPEGLAVFAMTRAIIRDTRVKTTFLPFSGGLMIVTKE
jgi:hypothetical protein